MGIEATSEEAESNKMEVVSISSDQLYPGEKGEKPEKKEEPVAAEQANPESTTEAAAITMAKQAAKNFAEGKETVPKKTTSLEID